MISLKWKIQAWHAIILAAVLTILGVGFYFNEREHRLTELDFILDQQIHPLIHTANINLGVAPPLDHDLTIRPDGISSQAKADGWTTDPANFDLGDFGNGPRQDDGRNAFDAAELRYASLGFYSIIWNNRDGQLIYRSKHAPDMAPPQRVRGGYMKRIRDGRYRELFNGTPTCASSLAST